MKFVIAVAATMAILFAGTPASAQIAKSATVPGCEKGEVYSDKQMKCVPKAPNKSWEHDQNCILGDVYVPKDHRCEVPAPPAHTVTCSGGDVDVKGKCVPPSVCPIGKTLNAFKTTCVCPKGTVSYSPGLAGVTFTCVAAPPPPR